MGLGADFAASGGIIHIDDVPVPQQLWPVVRPRTTHASGRAVQVTFYRPIGGGGDGKNVLAIVASIAIAAVSGGIANGTFLAGFTGATAAAPTPLGYGLAAGVSLAGSALLQALVPPPTLDTPDLGDQQALGQASAGGNELQPNSVAPRVVGTRRVFPTLVAEPLVTFQGSDEIVEAVYALAGPHKLDDIRIDGTPIGDVVGASYEIREGWPGDTPLTTIQRYARTTAQRQELRGHVVQDDGQTLDPASGNTEDALPVPAYAVARDAPDEVQAQFVFPQGVYKFSQNSEDPQKIRIPFRIRARAYNKLRENRVAPNVEYPATQGLNVPSAARSASVLIVTECSFDAAPTGTVFEFGGAINVGCYCGVTAGELVWRWGNGGDPATNSDLARIVAPLDAVAGKSGNLICEADIPNQTATMWFRETGAAEPLLLATGSTGAQADDWTNGLAGGVGDVFTGTVTGEDGGAFNGTITTARINYGHTLPDEWFEFPELHYRGNQSSEQRATVRFLWTDNADQLAHDTGTEGWAEARVITPGQAVPPLGEEWRANGYFRAILGPDYLDDTTVGTTKVKHVTLDRYTATFYLDPALIPKGRYEFEIRRGAPFKDADYDPATYQFGDPPSTVLDPFTYHDPGQAGGSYKNSVSATVLARLVSIRNEHPVPHDDFALIAIRARNVSLSAVSVLAAGYVPDWDGAAWAKWITTSNPAPHLRDIFAGALNPDPVPLAILDDAELIDWRAGCAALGYTVNAILSDRTVDDCARLVAAAGFARPRMADRWGVVRDYDRSGEGPVQVFTPRNSSGFAWSKSFAVQPDGMLITFANAAEEYEDTQILEPATATGDIVQISYDAEVTEAGARARAAYDLGQLTARANVYTLDASAEALVCRSGDLVAVQSDMLSDFAGSARVLHAEHDDAGAITALVLDDGVPVVTTQPVGGIADIGAEADIGKLGATTSALIRRTDGTKTIHTTTSATGTSDRLEFSPAIPAAGAAPGVLVAVGRTGSEYRRLVVAGITGRPDFGARLTLFDEAPELFA